MHAYPETIVCKFGRDPAIWLREEAIFVPAQKCPYHVTFDLHLDLEHILDARWPGVHLVKVWWRSGHLPERRSDLRKSLQTDRRRMPRHCISSFLEWAKKNKRRKKDFTLVNTKNMQCLEQKWPRLGTVLIYFIEHLVELHSNVSIISNSQHRLTASDPAEKAGR